MTDPPRVRFGSFDLDLQTGELRKHGIRLKLQEQPFQVLRALLERPGELVTREEIQRRVWGESTFVDFDQSLNRAINKVREALGDTAGNPRYIETMARRGYRFIAPVEELQEPVELGPSPELPASRPWGKIAGVAAGILFAAGAGLWSTWDHRPPAAPRLTPLTTYPGSETAPAFSPDGEHVAFSWNGESPGNYDLYVKVVGSVTPLRLTSDPAFDGYAAWSPDGRQIAFGSSRDGGGIYLVSSVGGPQWKVAELSTNSRPAWTADGKHLIVATWLWDQALNGGGALWLVPMGGSDAPRRILTPPEGSWYAHPAVAPDGRRLAFVSCSGAQRGSNCVLYVVDLQSEPVAAGSPRQITRTPWRISGLDWSPDGSSLIYSAGINATDSSLWRVNAGDGTEPERVELAGRKAYSPAIAAKSGRLAFMRLLSSAGLYRLHHGGKPEPFLASSSTTETGPQYSPDGQRVAFNSDRHVGSVAVWVANADGTGATQITHLDSPSSGTPRWSPDSRWLAFDSRRAAGGWDIHVVGSSGGSLRQLSDGTASNLIPSWAHDGNSIYYASNRTGRFEIWRTPAGGGAAEQVTRNGGFTAFDSTDGKTLYYTLSDRGSEGLYAKRLPGGEEKQILKEEVAMRGFAVFNDGIYYLHPSGENRYEICFYEFAEGRSRVAAEIEGRLFLGFTVTPDRKTFVFSKWTDAGSDLMLIDRFR